MWAELQEIIIWIPALVAVFLLGERMGRRNERKDFSAWFDHLATKEKQHNDEVR